MKLLLLITLLLIPFSYSLASQELTPGARAVDSGQLVQDYIRRTFKDIGFVVLAHSEWEKKKEKYYGEDLLLTHVPYSTIYNHTGRMKFLIKSSKIDKEIYVSPKRQSRPGSFDERLPYVYLNAKRSLPDKETILIMTGQGWRDGAVKWIRQRAEDTDGFYVMNHEQFKEWANRKFLKVQED